MATAKTTTGNLLLGRFTSRVLRALAPREEDHAITDVLIRPDETPGSIFFPHFGAVVSIIRSTESGAMVEAGVVGNEGMFNVHTVITKPAPTGAEALVQIDGRVSRVDAALLHNYFRDDERVRDLLLSFTSLFLHQVTQNLLCNRLHAIEQRLAKWLLIIRDRIATDEMHMTQDFLSHMLGVHRPGVSIAVSALEVDGLIKHSRNRISIRDHAGLLARSCECSAPLHASLKQFRATL
ncbi:MAG TPA: Crp/Fnr family transcriptional regulator [Thermoanaerobaculia bacterium]|jgi:CRP-like cAMP-binding protein|nr:Crp/Fnr family transcriptional regulator [Thermoanaerobaculia bacterium]